mmetsp:Transcript_14937/g.23404  ORF Transcript_14937/g.23404 Transcript_14937/m.23404 type:complete len:207 (-) Transcript_14937:48-668(-)
MTLSRCHFGALSGVPNTDGFIIPSRTQQRTIKVPAQSFNRALGVQSDLAFSSFKIPKTAGLVDRARSDNTIGCMIVTDHLTTTLVACQTLHCASINVPHFNTTVISRGSQLSGNEGGILDVKNLLTRMSMNNIHLNILPFPSHFKRKGPDISTSIGGQHNSQVGVRNRDHIRIRGLRRGDFRVPTVLGVHRPLRVTELRASKSSHN